MARRARKDIEQEWYDCFARWSQADREAALKVLATLHRALPEHPRARLKNEPSQPALPGTEEK